MDEYMKQFIAAQQFLPKVEIISIATAPSCFIARVDSKKAPPNSAYIQMEHMLWSAWEHSQSVSFTSIPGPGTLVIATDETRRTFKRGIILKIEQSFEGGNLYYVFLFDWGQIQCCNFQQLNKLSPEFQAVLPPRAFIIILAGVVRFDEKYERFRDKRLQLEARRKRMKLKCPTDKGYHMERENCHYLRHWLDTRVVRFRLFKSLYDVIQYGELLGWDHGSEDKPGKEPQLLADEMEKLGFTVLSPVLEKIERSKVRSGRDNYFLALRLESLKCFEFCTKRKEKKEAMAKKEAKEKKNRI